MIDDIDRRTLFRWLGGVTIAVLPRRPSTKLRAAPRVVAVPAGVIRQVGGAGYSSFEKSIGGRAIALPFRWMNTGRTF